MTIHFRAGIPVWQDEKSGRKFDLIMDLNNLFDAKYREAFSQQELVAPGPNFVVTGSDFLIRMNEQLRGEEPCT